jgi:hypothetical protein
MGLGRVRVGYVLLLGLVTGSVAASHGSPWPPQRMSSTRQWKGSFIYERRFASRSASCDVHGDETMQGVISCKGDDPAHLRCSAEGTVRYSYDEEIGFSDVRAPLRRTDVGEYSGPLSQHLDLRRRGQDWRYDLGIDANVPIHYTEAAGDGRTRNGAYLLDVAAGTELAHFNPASGEINFERNEPVSEPGPQSCGSPVNNGKSHFAFRLLTDGHNPW